MITPQQGLFDTGAVFGLTLHGNGICQVAHTDEETGLLTG